MCHALLSSSTLSRALAASLLLCVYVSVVLLSFTHSKNPAAAGALSSSQAEAALAAAAGGRGGLGGVDRTYVTAIWAEDQLPSLIALAHSLMQTRSEFGLLLLLPTGAPAADRSARTSSSRSRRASVRRASRRKTKGRTAGHDRDTDPDGAAAVGDDADSTVAGAAASSGEEVVHAWSEDTLSILRAIPNLTLQLLPHVRFPPPQPLTDARTLASEGSFSTTQAAQADVSFTSAVRTLLLFEVWRLTNYKQVLYVDVNSIVQRNIDHLLQADSIEAVPLGDALAKQQQRAASRKRKKQPQTPPPQTQQPQSKAAPTNLATAAATTMMSDDASPAVAAAAAASAQKQQHVSARLSAAAAQALADLEADESDDRRRAEVIDAGLERWLHAHSMHEAHLPTPVPDASSTSAELASTADRAAGSSHSFHAHLSSIDWADAVAHSTPAYLQLAAPMQLAREDCARFDAVAAECARDFDAEAEAHEHSAAASVTASKAAAADASKPRPLEAFSLAGHTSLLSPSLSWSLFNSNLLLLSPNSYTYHLLLQSYTHTHVERRDRFDPRHFEHRLDRIKYGNYPAKILNHFFTKPCAASSSGTGHVHVQSAAATGASAAADAVSTPTGGCWHPLRLNLSLTSHTCGCMDGAGDQSAATQPVLRYSACATPGRLNPWLLLPSSVATTLRECDQLTIQSGGSGEGDAAAGEERDAAASTESDPPGSASSASSPLPGGVSPAASGSSTVPRASSSYYSALLSSLSWLFASSAERASHRFAELYLREQEAKAKEALDAAKANRTADSASADSSAPSASSSSPPASASAPPSASVSDEDLLSSCCHSEYSRVLQTYYAALRFIRPNFDEPPSSASNAQRQASRRRKRKGSSNRKKRGG